MPKYTVCSEFVKFAGNFANLNYFLNVLMVFTQDNACKICIDNQKKILSSYESIAKNSELTRSWLSFLSYKEESNFEMVEIDVKINDNDDEKILFINVCGSTVGEKNLIAKSSQEYVAYQTQIKDKNIQLYDKDEAKEKLNTRCDTIFTADHGSVIATNGSTIKKE